MSGERRLRPALRAPALWPWVAGCVALCAVQAGVAVFRFPARLAPTRAADTRAWRAARLEAMLDEIAAVPPQQRDWLRAMVAIQSQMGREAVGPLAAATRRESESARRFALEALGMLGDPQTLPVVLAALEDPNPLVVSSAVTALGDLGGPAARDALIEALGHSSDVVRVRAAQSLAFVELERGDLEALIARADDESQKVREAVHVALTTQLGLGVRAPQRSSAEWREWLRARGAASRPS